MTYGRIKSVIPEKDVTFRGRVELYKISEAKVAELETVDEGMEVPSSPLKETQGIP